MPKSNVRCAPPGGDRRPRATPDEPRGPDTIAEMDKPTATEPGDRPNAGAGAGDRPARQPTHLERAPSERYAHEEPPEAGTRGQVVRALGIAVAGAAVIAFLGGPLSMSGGLLAVSVVVGIVLGSTLRPRTAVAVGLAVGSVVVGLLGVWLFSRLEGGVLDPLAYLADVEGPLAPIQLLLAGASAAVSSR